MARGPRSRAPAPHPPAAATAWPEGLCPFAAAVAEPWHGQLAHEHFRNGSRASRPCHALVLTTTCDQMRRIAESIERDTPPFLMNIPATWQTRTARDIYAGELHRLGRWLVHLGGTSPAPSRLITIMRKYDAQRRERATAIPSPATPGEGRVRALALVGGPLRQQDQWLFDCIAQAGGHVALDATETGQRTLPAPFDDTRLAADPFTELASAYFTIPDVFRRPDTLLHEYLARELPRRQVRGIVLVRHLWCDQWHAQLGRLRESTALPVVEIDLGDDGDIERSRNRIEALLNILK